MRLKFLTLLLAGLLAPALALAAGKISELPSASVPLAGTEQIEVLQGSGAGANKRMTLTPANIGAVPQTDTGTSGHKLPYLDQANTFSAKQIFSGPIDLSGLASGTCAAGLALDSGNHLVLTTCPGGGGGGGITLSSTNGGIAVTGSPGSSLTVDLANVAATSNQWFNAVVNGALQKAQPTFSSLGGSIAGSQIPSSTITYAKIQNGAANGLLGVNNGAAPSEVTVGSGLQLSGGVLSNTASGGTVTSITAGRGLSTTAGTPGGTINTTGTLNPYATITEKSADYTLAAGDEESLMVMNSGLNRTFTLPLPTASGTFATGKCVGLFNLGAGILTIDAQSRNINGFATITLHQYGAGRLCSDGTNWRGPIGDQLSIPIGVAFGGTGVQTLPDKALLVGAGTGPVDSVALGINGQLLLGVTGAKPAFGTMSGDGTISNAGVFTLGSSLALAGSPTTTTQSAKDNSTKIATTAYVDRAAPLTAGTSVTLTAPRQYFVCTNTCTITVPAPAAGYEFCVRNGNNVTSVITFAAIGSSAMYEKTNFTQYGTAGTGTAVSGGAAGDKLCLLGLDSTHYLVASSNGTWTMN